MSNLCKRNIMKEATRSLQKYLLENPICKSEPQFKGYCIEHLPYKDKLEYEWHNTTQEKRQEYLDLLHSGLCIGDAREKANISFEAAIAITNKAIGAYHYLERVAV